MTKTSELEEMFAGQLRLRPHIPTPCREYRFHPVRRWKFDFAWPDCKLAVEIEGAIWTGGRHTRGGGARNDMEKYNTAVLDGWAVLRFDDLALRNDTAADLTNEVRLKIIEKLNEKGNITNENSM